MAQRLTAESAAQLQEGISLVLSRWSALQIAVENEWGGRDSRIKSQQFAVDVFSWFTLAKEQLYIDDLENMLYEFMLSLNTEIEDGSDEEVAEKLMVMHEECLEGNYSSIQLLRETNVPRALVSHIRQADNDEDDDSDEEGNSDGSTEMEVDTSGPQTNSNQSDMAVEEPKPNAAAEADDGWTQVSNRRNRGGKRN